MMFQSLDRGDILMAQSKLWSRAIAEDNAPELFEAAKTVGPQEIRCQDGFFVLSFIKRKSSGNIAEFLSKGGPDDLQDT